MFSLFYPFLFYLFSSTHFSSLSLHFLPLFRLPLISLPPFLLVFLLPPSLFFSPFFLLYTFAFFLSLLSLRVLLPVYPLSYLQISPFFIYFLISFPSLQYSLPRGVRNRKRRRGKKEERCSQLIGETKPGGNQRGRSRRRNKRESRGTEEAVLQEGEVGGAGGG